MPGLPATGTLEYNGVAFTGAHHVTTELEPIYDDSGRLIVAHRITINVDAILAEDRSLDRTLEELRFRLEQPRRPLVFINKGFGDDLIVNRGRVQDIRNGPKPNILSWEPVGDDRAAEIKWSVTTEIPPCRVGRFRGVSFINWSASWSMSSEGTTRRLGGFIEIASPRLIGGDTADAYRDFFSPPLLAGFDRTQEWTTSLDKSRVNFDITDVEIPSPNPYAEDMTSMSGGHRAIWIRGKTTHGIDLIIAPRARLSGSEAWNVFLTIAAQRLSWAVRKGKAPIVMALEVDEDFFGRPQRFRLAYRFVTTITNFVSESGLWRPLGTSWDRWTDSLRDNALSNRGDAGLRDIASDDAGGARTLCLTPATINPNNNQNPRGRLSTGRAKVLKNETPPPDKSWLDYKSAVVPMRDRPVIRQSKLQGPDDTTPGSYDSDVQGSVPSTGPQYGDSSSGSTADTIQVSGVSRYAVRLIGTATRVGHKIPRPRLQNYGSQEPIETASVFLEREDGNWFGVTIYKARWAIDYIVSESPGAVAIPVDQSDVV